STFRKIAVPLLGPLRSPTQDKPARHNSPPTTDFVLTGCVDTYGHRRQASSHIGRCTSVEAALAVKKTLGRQGLFLPAESRSNVRDVCEWQRGEVDQVPYREWCMTFCSRICI
ncbi:hypothetical protein, partial [Pseudomonas fluorescens]